MLLELQNELLLQFGPFLDVDVSGLVAPDPGAPTGSPNPPGFSIRTP